MHLQQSVNLEEVVLPRKRKHTKEMHDDNRKDDEVDSMKQHFCLQHYEALDLVTNFIQQHFNQPDMRCTETLKIYSYSHLRMKIIQKRLNQLCPFIKMTLIPHLEFFLPALITLKQNSS